MAQPVNLLYSLRKLVRHARKICLALLVAFFAFFTCIKAQDFSLSSLEQAGINPVWYGLAQRLARDGLYGPQVNALLAQLGPSPTQSPMGRKILELYRRQFMQSGPKSAPPRFYKGVVTQANASLCRQFIDANRVSFETAYMKYGVPPAIASALLFVETRLGKVLGDVPENAFVTLASMAISTRPQDISQWLPKLTGYQKHEQWLDDTLKKRSDWAYRETRALVEHMIRDNIPPSRLPGSIYGAVGLCQFMPSNISAYAVDGDGDGKTDLFTEADAIASLANYLARHGWKKGVSPAEQHRLLMTYNHSTTYANTILALAALVENPQKTVEEVEAAPKTSHKTKAAKRKHK